MKASAPPARRPRIRVTCAPPAVEARGPGVERHDERAGGHRERDAVLCAREFEPARKGERLAGTHEFAGRKLDGQRFERAPQQPGEGGGIERAAAFDEEDVQRKAAGTVIEQRVARGAARALGGAPFARQRFARDVSGARAPAERFEARLGGELRQDRAQRVVSAERDDRIGPC